MSRSAQVRRLVAALERAAGVAVEAEVGSVRPSRSAPGSGTCRPHQPPPCWPPRPPILGPGRSHGSPPSPWPPRCGLSWRRCSPITTMPNWR
ncbi:hypothetical protein [Streptosporangium vulgare]|uniref:hypothetical protein n=1 Tax=Streptosporangium vulgare TaxID=46190 RepID=UPI0036DD6DBD